MMRNVNRILSLITSYFFINGICLAQDAGLTNPANGLIFSTKYSNNISEDGDYNINGWSNTGKISSIKVYLNGSYKNANNPNSGSWDCNVEFSPGVNEIYIKYRCNYSGCNMDGTEGSKRYVTFVKAFDTGDARVSDGDFSDKNEIEWPYYSWLSQYGGSPTIIPYFKVWRNTIDATSGGTWHDLTSWQTGTSIYDNNVIPGKKYYYFI